MATEKGWIFINSLLCRALVFIPETFLTLVLLLWFRPSVFYFLLFIAGRWVEEKTGGEKCRTMSLGGGAVPKTKGGSGEKKRIKTSGAFCKTCLKLFPLCARGQKARALPAKEKKSFLALEHPNPVTCSLLSGKDFTMVSESMWSWCHDCAWPGNNLPGVHIIGLNIPMSKAGLFYLDYKGLFFFFHVIIKTLNTIHRV